MTIAHRFVSAKADGADPTEVRPSNWNDSHAVDSAGVDFPISTGLPAAPATGQARLFGRNIAGRATLSVIGESGGLHTVQPHFGRNHISAWIPWGGNNTSLTTLGAVALQGTVTGRPNTGTGNLFASLKRAGFVSGATAGSVANPRATSAGWYRGHADGIGGFLLIMRFGCSDAATVADARSFYGFRDTPGNTGNVNPSTLLNIIGMGTDAGEANFSIMHNDGSGTATKIPLGSDFPDHTLSVDVYELALFAPPNASFVNYQVTRLNTGNVATGTITTDLPSNTTFLAWQMYRSNNTTALAVGVDLMRVYIETEF